MLLAWDQGHSWPHLSLLREFCFRPESHFNLVFFAGSLCSYHLLALEPLIIVKLGTRPLIANLTMYTIMGSNFPIHLQNP